MLKRRSLIGAICSQKERQGSCLGFSVSQRNCGRSGSTTFSHHCVSLAIAAADKETAFNSVIRTLEPKGGSSVLARALVMRAEFYHESGRHQDTIVDANEALTMPMTIQVSRRAWRLQADAHTSLGQVEGALRCLQDWMNNDSFFKSKIGAEMERLRRIMDV